jgi:hypothetical protein
VWIKHPIFGGVVEQDAVPILAIGLGKSAFGNQHVVAIDGGRERVVKQPRKYVVNL